MNKDYLVFFIWFLFFVLGLKDCYIVLFGIKDV